MTPPLLPRAFIAAVTPPADYESVAGDLHEEYTLRARSAGRAAADRWYWSQAARSIPALLSYSRAQHSLGAYARNGLVVLAVLIAMFACKGLADWLMGAFGPQPHAFPLPLYILVDWTIAAVFGAVLASAAPMHGVRLALGTGIFLVLFFAVPILLGVSSRLSLTAWVLILGAVPSLAAGAAAYQILRKR